MSEVDRSERLIVTLGQRISEQNGILQMIAASLQGVESHLRQIAISSNPAPNYQRTLSEYPGFDWSSIGATVLKEDSDGVSVVEWNGKTFTRRSANNKYPEAIWFSRPAGKDADGNLRYERLVTCKRPSEAEPIAAKAKRAISSTI
jgi:DdrB-like protein